MTIEDLQGTLKELRERKDNSSREVEQLKLDVNFYRQESAIYETKNEKAGAKLEKLKKKNSRLLEEKTAM